MDILAAPAVPVGPLLPPAVAAQREGQRIVRAVTQAVRTLHTALLDEFLSVWQSDITARNPDGSTRKLTPQEVFDAIQVQGQPAAAAFLHAHGLLATPTEAVRELLAPSLAPVPTAIPAGYTITLREDGGITVVSQSE